MSFIQNEIAGVQFSTAPNIGAKHAFTTRYGGVSSGAYSSFNLRENCPDAQENVRQNYAIFCRVFELDSNSLVFSHQVHLDNIKVCSKDDAHTLFTPVPYDADGLITNKPGVPLLVFSADCATILLHDPVENAIGAVHAGWRGTVQGIICRAVEKMAAEYGCKPENINAAIGPCISKCCYEVGTEVYAAARNIIGADADLYMDKLGGGKFMADIKGINAHLLRSAGVKNIAVSNECTMCLYDKYWSHRYTNGVRGTQCAFITL